MDIFKEYKPVRNKIALLAIDEALGTIWAYCQYLQINGFEFPPEVEVAKAYLSLDIPQQWISEWELELLAKEVIINGHAVSKKGRALRQWKTLSEITNSIKRLENSIYGMHEAPRNALVELIRIAHRQFIWHESAERCIDHTLLQDIQSAGNRRN